MRTKILVTGCAGFIGSSLTDRLLRDGHEIIGIDNFNDYYNPRVKEANISGALKEKGFKLYREDIQDFQKMTNVFEKERPQIVVHLAARAGVRPSIANPLLYTEVNVDGTVNLLKLASEFGVKKFIFGSSSSVYGNSPKIPFTEDDLCQNVISPYGATKRSAEFFVESFHHNHGLGAIILRFFTVYGQRGRPDMAPALFADAVSNGKPINKFGDGTSSRDYTYIDDIVDGIVRAIDADLDFEIINLGSDNPITLNEFIGTIEKITGKTALVNQLDNQPGDVSRTWANIGKAKKLLGWAPKTMLQVGLENYIKWLEKQ